ncbi:MAG: extracellular solute-binding protein [Ramlibacter sp.]|jgi:peptide/nickel transport system substrate-binding protein|nr:extracellular solute-binding protein [Ramlibacter sp.]
MRFTFLKQAPKQMLRLMGLLPLVILSAAPVAAQTITAAMQSPLRLLDPIVSTAWITRTHGFMIYDTLLATDANFKIQPQMAEKWAVSNDGKTYTFTLRDGLKWHDGTPVNSEDCIASFKRWAQLDGLGQVLLPMIAGMKAVDSKTFQISLNQPTTLVLNAFSSMGTRVNFMMPKRIAETPPTQSIKEYVGSGPFKFSATEYKPGLKVVYEKNKDYVPRGEAPNWATGGKVVKVDRVEWITMPDQMTTVNALLGGEIDYVEQMPFDLLPMAEGNKDVKVTVLDKLGTWTYYRFNFLYPPFDNKLIRQAAMYAVGQEDVLKAMIGNPKYYKTCVAIFGCGTPYESAYGTEMIVPSNIAKAKELLKAANYDGKRVVILHPSDNPLAEKQPVVIAAALRAAGFNVDLQTMDWQTLVNRRTSQKPPAEGGWNIFVSYSAVVNGLDPLSSAQIPANGKKAWFGWPDVPEIEKLRTQFANVSGEAERKKITEQLQKLAVDEGVIVPLGKYVSSTAYSNKLTGVLEASIPLFWNIKKSAK